MSRAHIMFLKSALFKGRFFVRETLSGRTSGALLLERKFNEDEFWS